MLEIPEDRYNALIMGHKNGISKVLYHNQIASTILFLMLIQLHHVCQVTFPGSRKKLEIEKLGKTKTCGDFSVSCLDIKVCSNYKRIQNAIRRYLYIKYQVAR